MRLKKLIVRDRGVLHHVDLCLNETFLDREYGLDFIVGVNGTGKSTVLRTIADIVDSLGTSVVPTFPFDLVLVPEPGAREITVTNVDAKGNLVKTMPSVAMPQVILFAAGAVPPKAAERPAGTLEEALSMSAVERLQKEVAGHVRPTGADAGSEPATPLQGGVGQVLRISTQHLPLVMLCGWLTDCRFRKGALKEAFKGANVKSISGFSLRLQLDDEFDEKDDTVALLVNAATRKVRNGSQYLLVYDVARNPELFTQLIKEDQNGLVLYRKLLALFEQEETGLPRMHIDLILERTGTADKEVPPLHLFDWLSDGEQAFLGRMALFPLLGEAEAVVLLDEPENHFNDIWKREIIRFLDHSLQKNQSHVLISTHASITLTDVPHEHVHILQHDGCHTVDVVEPALQTFGVDASDIMTMVFGTPQSTGHFSAQHIRDRLNQIARSRRTPEQKRDELKRFAQEVGPGYWRYVVLREAERVVRLK